MQAGPAEVAQAVARLRAGGLVAFPTETVYGLGADALSAEAVRRVFEVKGRPSHNPLIVHVAGTAMARQVVSDWPEDAETLARTFWPGPLTIVLPKHDVVPDEVSAGGPTIGVRCPNHPLTLELLRAFGRPLVGPSANPSGRVSPTRPEHVREAFTPEQVLVLDGGACTGGIESTVVKLGVAPRVLRAGLVTPERLAAALGRPVLTASPTATHAGTPESPGQLASHYAPRAPAILASAAEVQGLLAGVPQGVVVSHTLLELPAPHRLILLPNEARAYANRLYQALREADAANPHRIIIVRRDPSGDAEQRGLWEAVLDRVTRASAACE